VSAILHAVYYKIRVSLDSRRLPALSERESGGAVVSFMRASGMLHRSTWLTRHRYGSCIRFMKIEVRVGNLWQEL